MLNTLIKRNKLMLLNPVKLVGINLRRSSSLPLHGLEGFCQRLNILGNTQDKLVVAHINRIADQFATLRISPRNHQVLSAHHIPLEASSDQPVNVFSHGHKHLASQVATLLATMELVFKVNRGRTVLRKQLGQFQDCRQTTMSGD